jgi:uncharacterized membrane protein
MNKTLTATITMMVIGSNFIAPNTIAGPVKEKCYGVAKAGKNDCATKNSSCAGTSKTDSQTDVFLVVPSGLCERITGGSLSSS